MFHAVTELRTDFWRETFYGWTTDNGQFCYEPATHGFTAEVVVSATHTTLFGSQKYPDATVTLAQPVPFDGGFGTGTTASPRRPGS